MTAPARQPIPATAHFIWLGDQLDWVSVLSIRSALTRGGFTNAVLHHEAALTQWSGFADLETMQDLELRVLDEPALFASLESLGGPALADVYAELSAPAARANVLRAVILWLEGGVYLDLDTVTVRDLSPLRTRCGAFLGLEVVAHPMTTAASPDVRASRLRRLTLRGLRTACRLLESGWRTAQRLEPLYPKAANNAVLGALPRHPLLERLLVSMANVDVSQRRVRFALGTHLLQRVLDEHVEADVEVLAPTAFFPIGPVVSNHWFRERKRMPGLSEVLTPQCYVVHWYASSRISALVPQIDENFVRAHSDRQLFSRLAVGVLDHDLDVVLRA